MNTKALLFTILASGSVVAAARAQAPDQFKNDREKYSYAAGQFYATDWKRREMDFDMDQLLRGLKDGQAGKGAFTEQELKEILNKFSQENFAKAQEKRKQLGEQNKKTGEDYLAANKDKPGVVTLPSGLQYKVISEGTGEIPKPTDTVTVNYVGTFIDGTEFDSSAKAGRPFTTRASGGIIQGWTEALTKMKAGAKWHLVIPASLAYGENGNQRIPPNTTLIFEIELLSIQPPPPPPAPVAPAAPLTSDIIKVPSLEEMKKGAKIETIKAEDVEKLQKQQQQQAPPK